MTSLCFLYRGSNMYEFIVTTVFNVWTNVFFVVGMVSSTLQWCYSIYELLLLLLGHMLFVMTVLHVCAIIPCARAWL